MMTEYRNIGFVYSWKYVPTEFYGIVPNQNLDVIDLSYTLELNKNLLRLKSFFGKSDSIIVSDDVTKPFENLSFQLSSVTPGNTERIQAIKLHSNDEIALTINNINGLLDKTHTF